MRLFNRVAIIGTGLIGGSLALAIKKKKLAKVVIGVSRHRRTLVLAKRCHAIDIGAQDFNIIKDADLIIFATPVNTILEISPLISRIAKAEAVVTDVGSTKKEIVSELTKLFPRYIGSHPLAGSEKRGIVSANANLFQDSLCLLTPTPSTHQPSIKKVKKLWKALGARVVLLNPSLHDKILSFISHLPHLIVFSLMSSVPKRYLKFTAAGFKDTTRIASSDARLWSDIFMTNRSSLLKALGEFEKNLTKIKTAIKKKNTPGLEVILKKAKRSRDSLR